MMKVTAAKGVVATAFIGGGNGFRMSSYEQGVAFDLDSNGVAERLSWTTTLADDGWLALDRNGNGIIDNGRELFGNYTDQPKTETPDGFLALGVLDQPQAGGNSDGWISASDRSYENWSCGSTPITTDDPNRMNCEASLHQASGGSRSGLTKASGRTGMGTNFGTRLA